MNEPIDWEAYRSFGPQPSARSALRVGESLVGLARHAARTPEARNAKRLDEACKRLRAALDRRAQRAEASDADPREVDLRADRAWGALEQRLRAWSLLAATLGPSHARVARANELVVALFADGTEFLKLPYAEQEVEMDRLLRTIDRDELERDLLALAGREFVDAVKSVQSDYHAAVTAMLERDDQKERIVTVLRDVVRAVENYAGSVIGAVDHEDADDVARVRRLLAPLANHRSAVASRDGARATDEGHEERDNEAEKARRDEPVKPAK